MNRTKKLVLQDVDRTLVDRDIRIYLTARLSVLANRHDMTVEIPWPSLQDIDVMVDKFSLDDPPDRLKLVISVPDSKSGESKSIIDPLYTRILEDGFANVEYDDHDAFFDRLKLVLAAVLLAINPLPRPTVATLLDVTASTVTRLLRRLYSVLQVPSDDTLAIQRLHKSFPDFLTDSKRCKNSNFHIDAPAYHGNIAILCLRLMKKSLKKNICKIPPYTMNKDVEDLHDRRKEFVGDALEYSCRFWTDHVSLASKTDEDIGHMLDLIQDFFEHRFLFWVEILSVLEDLKIAIYSLQRVQEWLRNIAVPTLDLQNSIADCQRFVLHFFDVIRVSAPHIYHTTLPSLPTKSQLLKQYESELATEVRVIGEVWSSWDACIRTIQVSGLAYCVAFSPNGKTIASGGFGYPIQIFDATTGVCEMTLGSHSDEVESLQFSPDGSLLASSSEDHTIMLWDIQTGGLVKKLVGHTASVNTVAFSPSGTMLVSGGTDTDIRVWSRASWNCDAIIKDQSSKIHSLCWLSYTVVASGSEDGLVKLWDIPARRWLKDFSSHTCRVDSISCSADGSKLASASLDIVNVYDFFTGTTLKTIPMSSAFVSLSPNGDRLVCGSSDLQIWDLSRETLMAHGSQYTKSACFSPDATLVASTDGNTVKLWTTEFHESPASHSRAVRCICFSEDGSLIASGYYDVHGTIKIWDATDCSCLVTLSCTDERTPIFSVAFSPNRTLVGAGYNGKVRIWDVESQKSRAVMDTSGLIVNHIRFSPDGSKLVSLSRDNSSVFSSEDTIQVWDVETGSLLALRTQRSVKLMTFSDSSEIVIQANSKLVKLKLCAVSPSSLPISPSEEEEMAGTSTPFDLVLSTDDELTIQLPSPSYRLLQERNWQWGHQWILDSQGRTVFHWLHASVSACHMRKLAVGTSTGRVVVLDFSNVLDR